MTTRMFSKKQCLLCRFGLTVLSAIAPKARQPAPARARAGRLPCVANSPAPPAQTPPKPSPSLLAFFPWYPSAAPRAGAPPAAPAGVFWCAPPPF